MWPSLEDMFLKEKFSISDEENDSDTGPEVSDVRIVYPDEVSDEDECDVFHFLLWRDIVLWLLLVIRNPERNHGFRIQDWIIFLDLVDEHALLGDGLSLGIRISPDVLSNMPFSAEELSKSFDWYSPRAWDFLSLVIFEIIDETKSLKETKVSISSVTEFEFFFVECVCSVSDTVFKDCPRDIQMKCRKGDFVSGSQMIATWTAEDLLWFGLFNQYQSSLVCLSNEQGLIAHRKKVKK